MTARFSQRSRYDMDMLFLLALAAMAAAIAGLIELCGRLEAKR